MWHQWNPPHHLSSQRGAHLLPIPKERTTVPPRDPNRYRSSFCPPLPLSSACPVTNCGSWCGVAILTASQGVLWHLLFGSQPRLRRADDNMKLWPFVLWRIMFSSAHCCGDKLENFFFQKLEKQIKGPLILFRSYFAVVNEARSLESEKGARSSWLAEALAWQWGQSWFSCSPDSLTDINTQAHAHIPGRET